MKRVLHPAAAGMHHCRCEGICRMQPYDPPSPPVEFDNIRYFAPVILPRPMFEPQAPRMPEVSGHGPPFALWVRSFWDLPERGALPVGTDKDGGSLYVGRTRHQGHLLPVKVAPSHQGAFVAWDGLEHSRFPPRYEVLVVLRGSMDWVAASDGEVPAHAFPAGLTADGETVFVARTTHDGTTTPGRLLPREGACHISYDGEELAYREYEVLVIS